ncbi:alpha-lytic protease prodomain-containing protein [Catellatospora sp. NPDC049609]|uniref:alpha-lytic protease prodomain-containing protein n=1 Tax=Catellatospora sp. NPDC049609 TaxID=3155505 RepID=UPI00342167F6
MSRNRRVIMSIIAATAVALSTGTLAAAGVIPAAWHPPAGDPVPAAAADPATPDGTTPDGAPAPATSPAAGQRAAGPTGATAAPTPAAPALHAPNSVAYLRATYGVSEAEALRRLALQQSASAVAARLAARMPDEYAGIWLDQQAGGLLRVGATRPDRVTAALAGVAGATQVRAVPAARSLRSLQATARTLAADLTGHAGVQVAVDTPGNQVVVTAAPGADETALRAALARVGGAARLERRSLPATELKSCDPLDCLQAPVRGGIRLDVPRDDGTVGGCTTGYTLRSRKTGELFVLTAGHCVVAGRHTRIDDTWHQYLTVKKPVVFEHPDASLRALLGENYQNDDLRDYAIMPFPDAATAAFWTGPVVPTRTGWARNPLGLINTWCPGGGCGGRPIAVTGFTPVTNVVPGAVVCATGSAFTPAAGEPIVDSGAGVGYLPGTRCGTVLAISPGGLVTVKICARAGDSGGPLFTEADGRAIGILKYGDAGLPSCSNPDEKNHYVPVESILSRVNSRTDLQFELLVTETVPRPDPR